MCPFFFKQNSEMFSYVIQYNKLIILIHNINKQIFTPASNMRSVFVTVSDVFKKYIPNTNTYALIDIQKKSFYFPYLKNKEEQIVYKLKYLPNLNFIPINPDYLPWEYI